MPRAEVLPLPTFRDRGLGAGGLLAYALLAMPLAFVALPIYVHVPGLYAGRGGLSLSMVGGVLLAARCADAFIDPLIGAFSDRLGQRKLLIACAVPLLAIGLTGLLRPPPAADADVMAWWLGAMLVLVYLGYSLATVNYYAWGAELSERVHERTRITATREGFALVGVVLAAVLPDVLGATLAEGLARLAWLFVALLLATSLIGLGRAPVGPLRGPSAASTQPLRVLADRRFRALLVVFALSGIAAAIPASLVLFFVADVLRAPTHSGAFLALYFVSAALGLPAWVSLSRRFGKCAAWAMSMLLALAVFALAACLGTGDLVAFALVCVLSGLALGAELALPPSLLADLTARAGAGGTGSYFGWWNFVAKLNLALAAGLALPLLQWLGYTPGARSTGALAALAIVYAAVPAVLKLLAALCLWRLRHRIEGELP